MDHFENYWSSSKKQDQKFYVAFCILSSLLENHLCSIRLRRLGIATWSSVSAYYASVMTGRLIVFISCGDFPIGHSSLAKFLKTGDNRMTMWLKDFAGQDTNNRINRNQVVEWLGKNIPHQTSWDLQIERWGNILENFSKCRVDVNYEGLIIAHRLFHPLISLSFERLDDVAEKNSFESVEFGSRVFHSYVINYSRRDYWIPYLNWDKKKHDRLRWGKSLIEGLPYLRDSLKHLMSVDMEAGVVNNLIEKLEELGEDDPIMSEKFYENISISRFDGKTKRMLKFRQKIEDLYAFLNE